MPMLRDPAAALELIGDLVAIGQPWRKVLIQSGTLLWMMSNGMTETVLQV